MDEKVVDSREQERLAERREKLRPQHKIDPQTPDDIVRILENIQREKDSETKKIIAQRVPLDLARIERAIEFWKNVYFSEKKDGRFLNGIEAYELGDRKITPVPNQAVFIAMSNLMALEALKMMGNHWPTTPDAQMLAFATEQEKEVADFWHKQFAPLAFQAEWAWKACLSVMAGEPHSTNDLLVQFRDQLP
jgi:hypothetical protein